VQVGGGTAWVGLNLAANVESILTGADVTMTTASTWYDAVSITLGVGTWLISGQLTCKGTAAQNHTYEGRIYNGTTAISSGNAASPNITTTNRAATVPLAAKKVTITSGTVTYTLQGAASQNTASIAYQTGLMTQGNCTYITAERIR